MKVMNNIPWIDQTLYNEYITFYSAMQSNLNYLIYLDPTTSAILLHFTR